MFTSRHFPVYTGTVIDAERLQLVSVLGQGGFGIVYKAVDLVDPNHPVFAVKWLGLPLSYRTRSAAYRSRYLDELTREFTQHALVSDHPNIVTLHRVVYDEARECYWMICDFVSGGDVFDIVQLKNPFWKNEERTRRVLLQLVDAISYCHAKGVYHGDIKPENILISEDGNNVYLSDFGAATKKRYSTENIGTAEYMAPEQVNRAFRRTTVYRDVYSCTRSDAWAVAITIFGILVGECPWEQASENFPKFTIATTYFRYGRIDNLFPLSEGFKTFFRDTFELDPVRRLDLKGMRKRIEEMDKLFPDRIRSGAKGCVAHLIASSANWVEPRPLITSAIEPQPSIQLLSADLSAFDLPRSDACTNLAALLDALTEDAGSPSTTHSSCPSLSTGSGDDSSSVSSRHSDAPTVPKEDSIEVDISDMDASASENEESLTTDMFKTPRLGDIFQLPAHSPAPAPGSKDRYKFMYCS